MPEEPNDRTVHEAIDYAEKTAATDADFVRLLRARVLKERPRLSAGIRLAPVRSAGPSVRGDRSSHIYEDPRYLQNARELARQSRKRLRVIGGTTVKGKQFPDCVAVGSDVQWACTGTLIGRKVVLTAGHCAQVASRVFFGNDVGKKGIVVDVARRVRHPKYNKGHRNDLMVLVLERDVTTVQPRALAPSTLIDKAAIARVVGFGNTEASGTIGYGLKRLVDVPIASPACDGEVNGQDDSFAYGCDAKLELIAGKPLLAKDSCTGDSGGPIYVADGNGDWFLAGATSRATDSAANVCGDGGVYVRVDRYLDWIQSIEGVTLG